MKKFYLIVLSILLINFSFASPINGIQNNAAWSNANTWDKNRKPQDGDTIVIPAGKTIVVNSLTFLNNVYIKVYGTLKFTGWFASLNFNSSSTVVVYNNASIQATIDYWQWIDIGSNLIPLSGTVYGPQIANSSTNGSFSGFNPLPVKFIGFSLTRKSNDVLIQWATASEVNADIYHVQRSFDGINWNTIAYIAAAGNSTVVNNYSYTDKNLSAKIAYYRIEEVDFDGKITITPIKSIKAEAPSPDIRIASIENKVLIQFPKQISGALVVRFVSMSGQIADQQVITNPIGQVILNSKVKGNYVISISNGQDINTAKQVIL